MSADDAFRTVVAVLTGNKIGAVPVVDASGEPLLGPASEGTELSAVVSDDRT